MNCYSCPGALGACPIGALQAVTSSRRPKVPFYVLGFLMPVPEIDAIIPALAYPTTYFIDENGNLLGDPVVGADINAYRARIADYLD